MATAQLSGQTESETGSGAEQQPPADNGRLKQPAQGSAGQEAPPDSSSAEQGETSEQAAAAEDSEEDDETKDSKDTSESDGESGSGQKLGVTGALEPSAGASGSGAIAADPSTSDLGAAEGEGASGSAQTPHYTEAPARYYNTGDFSSLPTYPHLPAPLAGFRVTMTVYKNRIHFSWPRISPTPATYVLYRSEDFVKYRLVPQTLYNTATSFTLYISTHKYDWLDTTFRVCATLNTNSCWVSSYPASRTLLHSRIATESVKANSPGAEDEFGQAVVMNIRGTVLAVSAPGDDRESVTSPRTSLETHNNSGAVYIYQRKDDKSGWRFEQAIKIPEAREASLFGGSMAFDERGSVLAVSHCNANYLACGSSAVHIFRKYHVWERAEKISPPYGSSWHFGSAIALSHNGKTLAIGSRNDGNATAGINVLREYIPNHVALGSGLVFIYTRQNGSWILDATIAPGSYGDGVGDDDGFGTSLAMSADGAILAVGMPGDSYRRPGGNIGLRHSRGDTTDSREFTTHSSGSVLIYAKRNGKWREQAYLRPQYIGADDRFGHSLSISADGRTLAVGAPYEDSTGTNINVGQTNNAGYDVGAVFIYRRRGWFWFQQAYLKPRVGGDRDYFGRSVALSANGLNLAVGTPGDDHHYQGVHAFFSASDERTDTGAVYMFHSNGYDWSYGHFVKSPDSDREDEFGSSVFLTANGNTLVVGAPGEDSRGAGVNADRLDNSLSNSGAAYIYGGRKIDDLLRNSLLVNNQMTLAPRRTYTNIKFRTGWSYQTLRYFHLTHHGSVNRNSGLVTTPAEGLSLMRILAHGWADSDYFDSEIVYLGFIEADYEASSSYSDGRIKIRWKATPGTSHYTLTGSLADNPDFAIGPDDIQWGPFWMSIDKPFSALRHSGTRPGTNAPAGSLTINECQPLKGCAKVTDFHMNLADRSAYTQTITEPGNAYNGFSRTARGAHKFGASVAMSADGTTIAVGSPGESNNTVGVYSASNRYTPYRSGAANAGAVRILKHNGSEWVHDFYIKAFNAQADDDFGSSVALSDDGNVLAVGAPGEDSNARGVGGNRANNSLADAGAVYIYTRNQNGWSYGAYIKSASPTAGGLFGQKIALSEDGRTLAVAHKRESHAGSGVNPARTTARTSRSGAVEIFTGAGRAWQAQAYIKASNPGVNDDFGSSIALGANGNVLAVGAHKEDSSLTGINNAAQDDNALTDSGAVYVYERAGDVWRHEAYIKPSRVNRDGNFGNAVSLSGDGSRLAVGARNDSSSLAVPGAVVRTARPYGNAKSGAVYLFHFRDGGWSEEEAIKSPVPLQFSRFGASVSLSYNGEHLAVGDSHELSAARGFDGAMNNTALSYAGAAFTFARQQQGWAFQRYVKSENPGNDHWFGWDVQMSANGHTLVVGEPVGYWWFQSAAANENPGAVSIYSGHHIDQALPITGLYRGQLYAGTGLEAQGGAADWAKLDSSIGAYVKHRSDRPDLVDIQRRRANYDTVIDITVKDQWIINPTEVMMVASHDGNHRYYPVRSSYILTLSRGGRTTVVKTNGGYRFNWGSAPDVFTEYRLRTTFLNTRPTREFTTAAARETIVGRQDLFGSTYVTLDRVRHFEVFACNQGGYCYVHSRFAAAEDETLDLRYFKADTPTARSNYGNAVALSKDGSRLAVGSPFARTSRTGNGNDGRVHIYRKGTDGQWQKEARLPADSQLASHRGAYFGYALDFADDGETLVIGSPFANSTDINGVAHHDSGAAYVFTRANNSWSQTVKLESEHGRRHDRFGHSVTISGDGRSIFVGAPDEGSGRTIGQTSAATANSGAVFAYQLENGAWRGKGGFKAEHIDRGDDFGFAVSLDYSGLVVVIGIPGDDSASRRTGSVNTQASAASGAAEVFYRNGFTNPWIANTRYIKPDVVGFGDCFGNDVSISGDNSLLAVGSYNERSNSQRINSGAHNDSHWFSGAAYIFDGRNTFAQAHYIKSPDSATSDLFGHKVALSPDGSKLYVAASGESGGRGQSPLSPEPRNSLVNRSGAVYSFRVSASSASFLKYYKAPNPGRSDRFGRALAASNSSVAVGAPLEDGGIGGIDPADSDTVRDAGAVYVIED